METLATRKEKAIFKSDAFLQDWSRKHRAWCEARGDGASTDSGIDRPRNVPSSPPLGEPHRITSPTPLRLTIRDTGTLASLVCWLLPFFEIHGVSLELSMTQIGGVPNDFWHSWTLVIFLALGCEINLRFYLRFFSSGRISFVVTQTYFEPTTAIGNSGLLVRTRHIMYYIRSFDAIRQ